jgi:general secretion pathway protein C
VLDKLNFSKKAWIAMQLFIILWIAWMVSGVMNKAILRLFDHDYNMQSPKHYTRHSIFKSNILRPDYSAVIYGNIFDSSLVQLEKIDGLRQSLQNGLSSSVGANGLKTSLQLKLVGTIWDMEGNTSIAAIIGGKSMDKLIYRVGDQILGATIVSISRVNVELMNNGKLEILEMDFRQGSARAYNGRPSIATGRNSTLQDVLRQSDVDYTISRQYVDSQLKNINRLLTEVRAVPIIQGGKATGFRLFSIRTGSVFSKIGFKNRDLVQRINGVAIDSAEKGLELFQALRNENNFEVDLLRNSQKKTLRYSIQ